MQRRVLRRINPSPISLRSQFHIYAIGTEECLNSIAKSVIVHSKKEWESTVKEILGSSYEMLCGHALQASGFFVHALCNARTVTGSRLGLDNNSPAASVATLRSQRRHVRRNYKQNCSGEGGEEERGV